MSRMEAMGINFASTQSAVFLVMVHSRMEVMDNSMEEIMQSYDNFELHIVVSIAYMNKTKWFAIVADVFYIFDTMLYFAMTYYRAS